MTDATDVITEEKSGGGVRRALLPLGLVIVLTAVGFGSTYLGFWSPMGLLSAKKEEEPAATEPTVEFVDIPQIVLTLPGPRSRVLVMTVKIETNQIKRAEVEHLTPGYWTALTASWRILMSRLSKNAASWTSYVMSLPPGLCLFWARTHLPTS